MKQFNLNFSKPIIFHKLFIVPLVLGFVILSNTSNAQSESVSENQNPLLNTAQKASINPHRQVNSPVVSDNAKASPNIDFSSHYTPSQNLTKVNNVGAGTNTEDPSTQNVQKGSVVENSSNPTIAAPTARRALNKTSINSVTPATISTDNK